MFLEVTNAADEAHRRSTLLVNPNLQQSLCGQGSQWKRQQADCKSHREMTSADN